MNLTEGQLLFRLQDFHGAEQEALGIGDYEFAQESADIACALRELLQARRTIDELTAVVGQRNGECVRLHSLLEAAEKRIAELSASHSKLRDTMAGIHNTIRMDGGYTPLAAILNAAKRAYEESATAAGIGVKGE